MFWFHPPLRDGRSKTDCRKVRWWIMLHVWLIPALILCALAIGIFYLAIRSKGGSGVRTEGRTVVDKPGEEDDLPPG